MRTPEENKVYEEGYMAYAAYGDYKSDNPYMNSELAMMWLSGYETAQDDYKEYKESQSPLREEDTGNYGEADH